MCLRFFLRLSPVWIMFFMVQYPIFILSGITTLKVIFSHVIVCSPFLGKVRQTFNRIGRKLSLYPYGVTKRDLTSS